MSWILKCLHLILHLVRHTSCLFLYSQLHLECFVELQCFTTWDPSQPCTCQQLAYLHKCSCENKWCMSKLYKVLELWRFLAGIGCQRLLCICVNALRSKAGREHSSLRCWQDDDVVEDPDNEFGTTEVPVREGPRIINVGIPGPGAHVPLWKRAWRDKIIPAVAHFNPDIIIISAGFDAHKKDDINFRYVLCTCCKWYTCKLGSHQPKA